MNVEAQAFRSLRAWHLALWFVAATLSTMCGIGGGLFCVPILHFLLGMPLKLSTTTSLISVFAMTLIGTLAELVQPGSAVVWPVVGWLCLGGLVGANVGQRVSRRIDPTALTWVFALAMCGAGIRVLSTSQGHVDAANLLALHLDSKHALGIVAIGFAGGFVAPLLGVGGGLIVVPALFLGVPGMTYLAARASSTAMSVANSAQLNWMNLRAGKVHRASAVPFSIVAGCGAVAGILLVHRPGWSDAARSMMGVMLLAVGAKFAWSGWRSRKTR